MKSKNWFSKINHHAISRNQNRSPNKSRLKSFSKQQAAQIACIILAKNHQQQKQKATLNKHQNYSTHNCNNHNNNNNKKLNILKYFQVNRNKRSLPSSAFSAKSETSLLSPVTTFSPGHTPLFKCNTTSGSVKLFLKLLTWNGSKYASSIRYQCSNLLRWMPSIPTTPISTKAIPLSYNCSLPNNNKIQRNNISMYVLMILLFLSGLWNGSGERRGLLLVEGVSTSTVLRPGTGNLSARLPRTSASQMNSGSGGVSNGSGNAGYKLIAKSLNGTNTRNGNLRTR